MSTSKRKASESESVTKEQAVVEDTVEQPGETQQAPLIYCGPNLPRGILNQFTVYQGGLPKHLEKYFEKCPAIQRLFVPVESTATTLQAIQKAGSAESVWFRQVTEYIQGGVK